MSDDDLRDFFAPLGDVSIRRLFGGKGIYVDGRIVALVVSGELMLKTDGETAPQFEAAGARQWRYGRAGREPAAMPYHSVPDEALDDPDAAERWLVLAAEAARRSETRTTRRAKSPRP